MTQVSDLYRATVHGKDHTKLETDTLIQDLTSLDLKGLDVDVDGSGLDFIDEDGWTLVDS